MAKIVLERKGRDFAMEARDEEGHLLQTDTSIENGGTNFGFRPMQLVLAALGSCSAIDMISILKKQRQQIDSLRIEIEGERQKGVIPALWESVSVTFFLSGTVTQEKAEKAAALSMEKYCSVAETMRRGGTIINWTTIITQDQLL